MRKITMKEMGMGWLHCLAPTVLFFTGAAGSLYLYVAEHRASHFFGFVFLFGLGSAAGLWPILRLRESQGVRTKFIRDKFTTSEAVHFPGSRTKEAMALLWLMTFATGILGIVGGDAQVDVRTKFAMATAILAVIFYLSLRLVAYGDNGIAIVPEGIRWKEIGRAAYFIPWEAIAEVGLFMKKEPNVRPVPTFGINMAKPAMVQTSKAAHNRMIASRAHHGWHLYFLSETVTVPFNLVEASVQYYLSNPEARRELGTSAGLERIHALETQLQLT